MRFQIATMCEQGTRKQNEDYLAYRTAEGAFCFVLCDGLGGLSGGAIAAKSVCEATLAAWEPGGEPDNTVRKILYAGSYALRELQDLTPEPHLKTTVVAAVVTRHGRLAVGHTGDSRCYLFRKNKILLQTKDQTVAQAHLDRGTAHEKDVRLSPNRHKLLHVMDENWDDDRMTLDMGYTLHWNDAILLCSDGFWEFVPEREMRKCLRQADSADAWLASMKAQWNLHAAGNPRDNSSAIAILAQE